LKRTERVMWRDAFVVLVAMISLSACRRDAGPQDISGTGTVEAVEVTIGNKIPGQVLQVVPREGVLVKVGDVVARIDHADLDLELERSRAGVRAAEAQLTLLRRGPRKQEIRRAEQMVEQARAALDNARTTYRRAQDLLARKVVPQSNVDNARAQVDVLQAQHNASQEALSVLRAGSRLEQLHMAEANLDQAEMLVRILEKKIADCTVTSPTAGRVVARFLEPGELAGTGTPIVRVADLSGVWIMIYVSETELGRVRVDGQAEIRVDSFPDKAFLGKVTYVSPQEEFTPKNIQTKDERVRMVFGVKVEAQNPDESLKPGMPADVVLLDTRPEGGGK
jgi:HlyD family secretion protein